MNPRSSETHRLFAISVAFAVAAAVVIGLLVKVPPDGPPGATLGSELVFRLAVGALFFLVFYLALVLVRLAYHGKTPTKIGTSGADFPDISDLRQSVEEYARLEESLSRMETEVTDLAQSLDLRIARLEKAGESADQS
jgi:hypothetical protein